MTATEKRWRGLVDAWARSGLSCKEYAASVGVNPRTLTWWKSKLKEAGPAASGTFVEVMQQLAAETHVETRAETGVIELAVGGTRIYVRGHVESEALTRVLDVLEARR